MRKSVPAFVFGLIGSIFSLWWGFAFGILGDAVGSIVNSLGGTGNYTFTILGWLAFIGGIVGIIGASSCFKKAKKGGIILICATVLSAALLIYVFINAVGNSGAMVPTLIILFLLPVILLVVADVCALTAKETNIPNNQNIIYTQVNTQPLNTSKKKTLEEELLDLKTMLDKNLLTEEEYAQAKKNVLEKFTK